jgi:hypothetical protein
MECNQEILVRVEPVVLFCLEIKSILKRLKVLLLVYPKNKRKEHKNNKRRKKSKRSGNSSLTQANQLKDFKQSIKLETRPQAGQLSKKSMRKSGSLLKKIIEETKSTSV